MFSFFRCLNFYRKLQISNLTWMIAELDIMQDMKLICSETSISASGSGLIVAEQSLENHIQFNMGDSSQGILSGKTITLELKLNSKHTQSIQVEIPTDAYEFVGSYDFSLDSEDVMDLSIVISVGRFTLSGSFYKIDSGVESV
jgi:hypothetical protein